MTETWISTVGRECYPSIGRHFDDDAEKQRLRLYCDATPSEREILGTTEAGFAETPQARLCVVIPAHDIVILKKFSHHYLCKNGAPDVTRLEYLAIERAWEYCHKSGIESFSIYTDSQAAQGKVIKEATLGPEERVRWLKRDFNPAGIILDRITHRARYLAQTKGKVAYRRPNAEQEEILHLMQAENLQCPLSNLRFWATIIRRKMTDHAS